MGNKGAKLKKEKLEKLHASVPEMDIEEIKTAYEDFRRGARGKSGLKLKDFVSVYTSAFGTKASALAVHIFKAFDIDGDGKVTFEEFLIGLSVTDMKPGISRESRMKKLKFFFEVYDTDRSGTIDRDEMRCLVRAVTGIAITPPEMHGKTPDQFADELFDEVDLNGDGDITFEEFVQAADQNECLIDLILPVPPDDEAMG